MACFPALLRPVEASLLLDADVVEIIYNLLEAWRELAIHIYHVNAGIGMKTIAHLRLCHVLLDSRELAAFVALDCVECTAVEPASRM